MGGGGVVGVVVEIFALVEGEMVGGGGTVATEVFASVESGMVGVEGM